MRGLIRALFFSVIVYGGWKKFNSAYQDLSVVVKADGIISDSARESIKVYVQGLLKKALPVNEVNFLLHQAFPHLAKVVVKKDPFKKVYISVFPSKPLAVCNDSVVLCSNDHVVSKDFFTYSYIKSLPLYQVADAQFATKTGVRDFKESIRSHISDDISNQYLIAWNSPEEIVLHDKDSSFLTLTVDKESIKNMHPILVAYNSIKQSLLEKTSTIIKSKKNKILAWNIDGRFKNQMIVAQRGVVG